MSRAHIVREIAIERTPRVMQVEGIFELSPLERSQESWDVNLELPDDWNIGVIVGPSGSGKTTIAKELFAGQLVNSWTWDESKSILDSFPADMSIKEITLLLSSVGFSSPPAWLRPYHVLSNGEQFRVHIARTLAEMPDMAVVDEFTSVVDRTVAQIGSAAIQKTVRRRNQKLIAVTCHYDVLNWLEPDWVYQPHINRFEPGRFLWRRPSIDLTIRRVHHSVWHIFAKHHYLNTSLNKSARCFVAFWNEIPVAFSAWLRFLHARKRAWREHRTITLPDYQGVGIGNILSDAVSSMICALGFSAISTTSHPAMISSRNKSDNWKMTRQPSRTSAGGSGNFLRARAKHRFSTGFEYVGVAMNRNDALALWDSD